ncbi:MAG: ATP12 family chaperone protein [Rubricella sp.]
MSEWRAKRFWASAGVDTGPGGFRVLLDGRPFKTPARSEMIVPTEALALAVAAEWDAQVEHIRPETMPFTRAVNVAIDRVGIEKEAIVKTLAAYADSDLLCYRAESPAELAARQAERWDPLLDWAAATLGARLVPVQGVMHAPQDPRALAAVEARIGRFDSFELTALHDLVTLPGSAVLGLAVAEGHLDPPTAWALSRLDELWQQELWGVDDEAERVASLKRADFEQSARFLALLEKDA